ncbi:MAG TPA: type II toxin-antitoxin system VapC family toxin [Thermoanaerobaculia bacterium]|nr:type II toxin-antitoxin system VapC family toxin [Thermoanaerobaculia bacterium]
MRFLLDTHIFLWFIGGSERLRDPARTLLVDPENEALLSVASLWEIAIKVNLGKLTLERPFEELIPEQLSVAEIDRLPIRMEHLATLSKLSLYHRDPFDRLIIAQAIAEGVPVLSSDPEFRKYPVQVIG